MATKALGETGGNMGPPTANAGLYNGSLADLASLTTMADPESGSGNNFAHTLMTQAYPESAADFLEVQRQRSTDAVGEMSEPLPSDFQHAPGTLAVGENGEPGLPGGNMTRAIHESGGGIGQPFNPSAVTQALNENGGNIPRPPIGINTAAVGETGGSIVDHQLTTLAMPENGQPSISTMAVGENGEFDDIMGGSMQPPGNPIQQPGGMDSDFAQQLLTGIGDLFDQYLSSPDDYPQDQTAQTQLGILGNFGSLTGNQSMGATNQITPPPPPEAPMTDDTSSSLPASLGSQGMFTPGRGY